MFLTSRYHVVATMGVVLSLTSCADTEFVLRPPAPERFPPAVTPPPRITESVITVPMRVDLSDFLNATNNPTSFQRSLTIRAASANIRKAGSTNTMRNGMTFRSSSRPTPSVIRSHACRSETGGRKSNSRESPSS